MVLQQGLIAEGQRGQRRGLVLGFTMAELMLLLLFCLLLVSAGILLKRDEKIAGLEQQLSQVQVPGGLTAGELAQFKLDSFRLNQLLLLLFPNGQLPSAGEFDELWRQLKLAKDDQDRLISAGLTQSLSASQGGLDPEKLAQLVRLLEGLSGPGMPPLTDDRIRQLAQLASNSAADPDASGHSWPPIISLGDDGNRFEVGSAEIKPKFRQSLETDIAGQVADLLRQYDVDVIEIIGHTDEQVIKPTRPSNLDESAIKALNGQMSATDLIPVDNAGLGLARAIAVADVLRASGHFAGSKIVPLSAAQLMLPGDRLSDGSAPGNDRTRRRIEIRVRRTTGAAP